MGTVAQCELAAVLFWTCVVLVQGQTSGVCPLWAEGVPGHGLPGPPGARGWSWSEVLSWPAVLLTTAHVSRGCPWVPSCGFSCLCCGSAAAQGPCVEGRQELAGPLEGRQRSSRSGKSRSHWAVIWEGALRRTGEEGPGVWGLKAARSLRQRMQLQPEPRLSRQSAACDSAS